MAVLTSSPKIRYRWREDARREPDITVELQDGIPSGIELELHGLQEGGRRYVLSLDHGDTLRLLQRLLVDLVSDAPRDYQAIMAAISKMAGSNDGR